MTMTREDMLRELELLPVWKLRTPVIPTSLELVTKQESPQAEPIPEPLVAQSQVEAEIVEAVVDEPTMLESLPLDAEPETVVEKIAPSDERLNAIKQMDWQALQDCVKDCQACSLAASRTQTVFGVGDANADWLIVGEAPGAEEDVKGEPFVGQAGKLLDNMLAAIQLKRGENVYIANVLKCRPPENRDPHGEEMIECDPFLKRQVELIQPKLIIALGKFAAQSLLQSESTIASLRGQLHQYNGVPVVVTYHPAYLLRNLADKAKAWEDLCFARKAMQNL